MENRRDRCQMQHYSVHQEIDRETAQSVREVTMFGSPIS
jgi:hypothetical protein